VSDRIILALAVVPMLSGILLVGVLQRGEARYDLPTPPAAPAARQRAAPVERGLLGVVVAGQSAELASEFDGRVAEVFARAGAQLRPGDPILRIDRDDSAAAMGVVGAEIAQRESDVLRAEARLEAAHQKLRRLSAGGSWLSAQELDAARGEVRVAEAELRAARSLVSMGRARLAQQRVRDRKHTLVAPFRGTLVSMEADRGDAVTAGHVLARVISDDRRLQFALPQEQLAGGLGELREVWVLREGMQAPLRAQISAIRPEIDPAAQLVFASAALPEEAIADSWLPGTDVRVYRSPEDVPSLSPKL
jgi:RND family efflux transporter MFP subunit